MREAKKEASAHHRDSTNVGAEERSIKITALEAMLYEKCPALSKIMKYPRGIR